MQLPRHFAVHYGTRKPVYNRAFAHPRFAYKHGVVFCLAAKNFYKPLHLAFPAYNGIEFVFARLLRNVHAQLGKLCGQLVRGAFYSTVAHARAVEHTIAVLIAAVPACAVLTVFQRAALQHCDYRPTVSRGIYIVNMIERVHRNAVSILQNSEHEEVGRNKRRAELRRYVVRGKRYRLLYARRIGRLGNRGAFFTVAEKLREVFGRKPVGGEYFGCRAIGFEYAVQQMFGTRKLVGIKFSCLSCNIKRVLRVAVHRKFHNMLLR